MNYLKQNELINLNIMGKILNNDKLSIFTDNPENPSGVMVKSGYMHFLYTESDAFISAVIKDHMKDGFYGFAGLDKELAVRVKDGRILHWNNPCTIYAYTDSDIKNMNGSYDVRPIEYADAEIVNQYYEYKNDHSLEDIRADIKKRPSSAVYVDGKPVCWVLVHEDNSMGIMYTLEDYRRKGLAEIVSKDLIKRIIEIGQIPYLQIVDGNEKSHGLAKKCGFKPVGDCEWFGIITGKPKELMDLAHKELKTFEDLYGHKRFSEEDCVFIKYFLMPWIPKDRDEHYTASLAESQADLELWRSLIQGSSNVESPSNEMKAWLIKKDEKPIGAALIHRVDEEDGFMHDFKIQDEADSNQGMWALMQAMKDHNIYFIETLIPEIKEKLYSEMKFESCGKI